MKEILLESTLFLKEFTSEDILLSEGALTAKEIDYNTTVKELRKIMPDLKKKLKNGTEFATSMTPQLKKHIDKMKRIANFHVGNIFTEVVIDKYPALLQFVSQNQILDRAYLFVINSKTGKVKKTVSIKIYKKK
jgi:hypothetical protein